MSHKQCINSTNLSIWVTNNASGLPAEYSLLHLECHFFNLKSWDLRNLNRWSCSLGLFCRVPLKRCQWYGNWRLKLNDTPNAIGCTWVTNYVYGSQSRYINHEKCIVVTSYESPNISLVYISTNYIYRSHLYSYVYGSQLGIWITKNASQSWAMSRKLCIWVPIMNMGPNVTPLT